MLTQIYYKKNELQEVEFFEDAECTVLFDFNGKKNLYLLLKDGDITPLIALDKLFGDKYTGKGNIYTPFVNYRNHIKLYNGIYIDLQDITPNLSKYIPEDNAVLFLSEEDYDKYRNFFPQRPCELLSEYVLKSVNYTIFLPHGTQPELQKANEIAKELKEKYGVEEVNLFVLHCFVKYSPLKSNEYYINDNEQYIKYSFDNFITTNSTGILPVQNKKTQRLQVIDCKEIFEEYLKENN